MAIYEITETALREIETTNFADAGFREREHLQQLLKMQIDVIAPDTLVISEEFGSWGDSQRRIDLLGVDRQANLVVIELKRTRDGGHMDLQAIRYAAMVSNMTFDSAVSAFRSYLDELGEKGDARERLLEFLKWEEENEDQFAQEVRIVLAAAEFSKEITTSVLWLNEHGLDIRCIRLLPYRDDSKTLLDVQQVIPLPEAEEYQVRIRDKARKERAQRKQSRDTTKYDVTAGNETFSRLPKRRAMYQVVRHLCDSGVDPEEIRSTITWKRNMMRDLEGNLDAGEFERQLTAIFKSENRSVPPRYFMNNDELIRANGKTYALIRGWGPRTVEAIDLLLEKFPGHGISYSESMA